MTSPHGLPPGEEHEQQLHQLSLRHTLQAQITAHTEQITQLQQHIDQRQAALTAELARHGLSLPAEDNVASWLSERANEAQMWQQRQSELSALQTQIAQLAPLLETLPETEALPENNEGLSLENWRQVHDDCLSLQGSGKLCNSRRRRTFSAPQKFRHSLMPHCRPVFFPIAMPLLPPCWMKRPSPVLSS